MKRRTSALHVQLIFAYRYSFQDLFALESIPTPFQSSPIQSCPNPFKPSSPRPHARSFVPLMLEASYLPPQELQRISKLIHPPDLGRKTKEDPNNYRHV
ncbi:hypothetical protein VTL71DRAFT_13613 [Oculimacula yallundae]|uniref:Uncharacterized protein n=1 Tax=Oculimacula yallundae TaxID=86028 RepID=A0ABR4CLG4_9HELO